MNEVRRIISGITFPGVIFHEFGHTLFCALTGVKVHKTCYFRFGNPAGYVIHERPQNFMQSFLIAGGPFISGTFFALLFFQIANLNAAGPWQKLLFIWLGASVAINCFPSNTDGKGLWKDTNRYIRKNFLTIVGYPFAAVIWMLNLFQVIFLDLIYAILLYNIVHPVFW